MINADWSKLKPHKKPEEDFQAFGSNFKSRFDDDWYDYNRKGCENNRGSTTGMRPKKMKDLIEENVETVVEILMQYGYDYEMLEQEILANSYGG